MAALLGPPLFLGVPRWFLTAEMALTGGMVIGVGWHPATVVVLVALLGVIHPAATLSCRRDPYAIEIFVSYLRRPTIFAPAALLETPADAPLGSVREL